MSSQRLLDIEEEIKKLQIEDEKYMYEYSKSQSDIWNDPTNYYPENKNKLQILRLESQNLLNQSFICAYKIRELQKQHEVLKKEAVE